QVDQAVPGDFQRPLGGAMATTEPVARRRLPKIVRIARTRPRLFICLTIGVVVIAALLLLKKDMDWALLIGWNVFGALYLVLALKLMVESDVHNMRRRSRLQDEGALAILIFTAFAALASLAAIFVLLITSPGKTRTGAEIILATVTILISWAFTHTMFA